MIGWKPKFRDFNVASVRYRCLNPLVELQRRRFPIELFDESKLREYSAVIFSKLYDDENYEIARSLKRRGKAVVFDICDNHFYNPYRLERFELVRKQLLRILGIADLVVASTATLAAVLVEEARLTSLPVVIGDAVEENVAPNGDTKSWLVRLGARSRPKGKIRHDELANILWFGIHGGENAAYGMLDLLDQKDLLLKISKTHPLQLVVVSDSRAKFVRYIEPLPLKTIYLEWGSMPLAEILHQIDVAIIPISQNPFTVCKTNNRLAAALYGGVPTVADEIPSYRDLAPYCVLNDWEFGLRLYLDNRAIGREHVKSAKAYISEHYSIKQIGDSWAQNLLKFSD